MTLNQPTSTTMPPDLASQDLPCLNCGYNLRGLSPSSNCPECGAPVQRSLQGNLLVYSSREYLASLDRGLLCILIAVVATIAVTILGIVAVVLLLLASRSTTMTFTGGGRFDLIISVSMMPISALLLLGWWLFSTPDPAILGNQTGQRPRTIIRAMVIVMACAALFDLLINVAFQANPGIQIIRGSASLLSGIASIAQFFASLLYIRWLAPRIPDRQIEERAGKFLWLLPVIYVVGAICLGLGPLVATIIYFVFLNRLRLRLRDIRHRHDREFGA